VFQIVGFSFINDLKCTYTCISNFNIFFQGLYPRTPIIKGRGGKGGDRGEGKGGEGKGKEGRGRERGEGEGGEEREGRGGEEREGWDGVNPPENN
jgi:hypothetical protein